MPCIRGVEVILVTYPAKHIMKEYPHPDGTSLRLVNRQEAAASFAGSLSSAGPSAASAAPALPTLKADPKSSVYVATEPGSQFIIAYEAKTIPDNCKFLNFKVFINGRHMVTCGRDLEERTRGVICQTLWVPAEPLDPIAGIEGRQFMFLREDTPKSAAEDGGVIEIRVHRASARSLRSPALQEFRRARQYGIATPSTGLIDRPEDVEYYMYKLVDPKETPYARFFFHYRSMESLVELNLVPQETLDPRQPAMPPVPPMPEGETTRSALRRPRSQSRGEGRQASHERLQQSSRERIQQYTRERLQLSAREQIQQSICRHMEQSSRQPVQQAYSETTQQPLREISQQRSRDVTPQPLPEISYESDLENAPHYLDEAAQQSDDVDSDDDRTITPSTSYLWLDGACDDDRPPRRSSSKSGARNQSRSSGRHPQSSQSRRGENAPLLGQTGRSNTDHFTGYGSSDPGRSVDPAARTRTQSTSPAPSVSSSLKRSIDDSDFDEDMEVVETKVVRYSKVLDKSTLMDVTPNRSSASTFDSSGSNATASHSGRNSYQPVPGTGPDRSARQGLQPILCTTTGSSSRHGSQPTSSTHQPTTHTCVDRSTRHSNQHSFDSTVSHDFAYDPPRTDRPHSMASPPHPAVGRGPLFPRDEPAPFPHRRIATARRWSPTPGSSRRRESESTPLLSESPSRQSQSSSSSHRPSVDSSSSSRQSSSAYPRPRPGRPRAEEMVQGVIDCRERRSAPAPTTTPTYRGPGSSTSTHSQAQQQRVTATSLPTISETLAAGGISDETWAQARDIGDRMLTGETFEQNRRQRAAQQPLQPSVPTLAQPAPTLPPSPPRVQQPWASHWPAADSSPLRTTFREQRWSNPRNPPEQREERGAVTWEEVVRQSPRNEARYEAIDRMIEELNKPEQKGAGEGRKGGEGKGGEDKKGQSSRR
ncbi:hypothetical protein GE09DRAFT_1215576 [Coniochaeta sp. 2T2.1]|nr:hypothetical protein GE09DRAFT_1215576 [Coniochaeta sp. 2T2.1]